jgi:hypothetical protein
MSMLIAESEDEGSESETKDEGDEDWTSNNEKYDESNDEDALNLRNLPRQFILSPGLVAYKNVFRCFSQKTHSWLCF